MLISEYLYLDMLWVIDILFDKYTSIAKSCLGFSSGFDVELF